MYVCLLLAKDALQLGHHIVILDDPLPCIAAGLASDVVGNLPMFWFVFFCFLGLFPLCQQKCMYIYFFCNEYVYFT